LAGAWHNTIIEILEDLCNEWVEKRRYRRVYDGNIDPIPVSYRKQVYLYKPDIYAIVSDTGRIDVFEVLDAESEGEAVMDIVYSALTPNINSLCMVCSEDTKLMLIKKHAQIILNKILDEEQEPLLVPNLRYFVHIPKEERVKRTIKKQLKERLEF